MTQPPDSITNIKLAIAKQLYQIGEAKSGPSQPALNRLLEIIEFDLASETVLKAVVSWLYARRSPTDGFPGLIDQCDQLMSSKGLSPIPNRGNLLYVHSIRNDAQHKARFPTDIEVSDCRTYTRDSLNGVLTEVWGLVLNSISLTDIIQDQKVRDYLVDAELARGHGRFEEAVFNANAGLDWALMTVQTAIVGPELIPGVEVLTAGPFSSEPERNRDLSFAVSRMQLTLLYSTLGISSSELSGYRDIAGFTSFTLDGGVHRHQGKQAPDDDDAAFVIGYSTQAIAQIEFTVGDIEKPFGLDYWQEGLP